MMSKKFYSMLLGGTLTMITLDTKIKKPWEVMT